MARYQYVILSRGRAGQDEEYRRWYDQQHLGDVLRVDGIVAANRYDIGFQKVYDVDVPTYTSLTVYEMETDDPEALIAKLAGMAGSPEMPMTDAADKSGMIQVVGRVLEAK